jgi:OmpA-OmpF porin, OOP family
MKRLLTVLIGVAALAARAGEGEAQGLGGRLRDRAKQATGEAVGQAVGGRIGGSVGTAPDAAPATSAAPAAAGARPGEGAWANYDFLPGERALFVDDFSRDVVGDFPRRLEFREGNLEVVEWNGGRYLRTTGKRGRFAIPLPEVLPERFTIEFDYSGWNKYELKLSFVESFDENRNSAVLLGSWGAGVKGAGVSALGRPREDIEKRMARVRIMADGTYVKVYVDEHRVANVPNASLGRASRIWVETPPTLVEQVLIGEIRIMAGGRKLYDALAAEGRVATQGILFDTGSDRIRPESTPTLKEIGEMLKQHPELRLRIEGHTDNVGQAAANQALSEKRAAAVRQHLVGEYGIDGSRLESAGLGASRPTVSNDTPEGRQQNRRVELVRI